MRTVKYVFIMAANKRFFFRYLYRIGISIQHECRMRWHEIGIRAAWKLCQYGTFYRWHSSRELAWLLWLIMPVEFPLPFLIMKNINNYSLYCWKTWNWRRINILSEMTWSGTVKKNHVLNLNDEVFCDPGFNVVLVSKFLAVGIAHDFPVSHVDTIKRRFHAIRV